MSRREAAVGQIHALARDTGIQVWVHARRLGPDSEELDYQGETQVPMASLYKLPLAACWADLVATGALDPSRTIRLSPRSRAPGPTGVSALLDPVELSCRDAIRMMLALSDNAAADAILTMVGLDRLTAWVARHGYDGTVVRRGSAQSWAAVVAETGGGAVEEAPARLAQTEVDVQTSEYDSALASTTTGRDLVAILATVWSADTFSAVRDALRLQAWRHRIGSGFPHDDVTVYGKTGTLGRLRHEAAVVHYPHEDPVAVAVLTKSARAEQHQPRVDAAIGSLARVAVTALRRPSA